MDSCATTPTNPPGFPANLSSNTAQDDADDDFLCPISYEVMQDPVKLVETGVTYERRAIETWLFQKNQRTCPATQRVLKSLALEPNEELRGRIRMWLHAHPSYHNLLEEESRVQDNLFPQVDDTAVAVHAALEKLGSLEDDVKLAGLAALCQHTSWPSLPSTLISTGCYLDLVQVVNTANDDAKAQALRCLRYVAKADGGVAALCEAGVIDTGVILLTGDDTATVARAQAVALLLALSSNFHNRVRLLYCGAVKSLITMLDSEESERGSKDKAAKLLSRLADVDVHDFRVQLQSARGMDVVLELLSSEHHRCQLASLSILTKMASKEAYRLEILEAGGAQMPVRLLRSANQQVQERAAALLAVFVQSPTSREQFVRKVGIEPFAALLLSDNESSKRYATNMLFQLIMADAPGDAWEALGGRSGESSRSGQGSSSSSRNHAAQDRVCQLIVEQNSLPVLVALLDQPDEASQQKAIMLISRLASVKKVDIGKFLEAGIVPHLVAQLESKVPHCMEHAAITIGCLATTNNVKRMFVDAGAPRLLTQMAQYETGRTQQIADTVLRKLLGISVYWHLLLRNKASVPSPQTSISGLVER